MNTKLHNEHLVSTLVLTVLKFTKHISKFHDSYLSRIYHSASHIYGLIHQQNGIAVILFEDLI